MSDPALLTILHISDFHFSAKKRREQEMIVEALVRDLQTLCIGHRRPDLVIFTGDLVQAAGVDQHNEAYDLLLDRVLKASGCGEERTYLVPGNHDLSWTGLMHYPDEHRSWRDALGRSDEMARLNAFYDQRSFEAPVKRKFAELSELERYLDGNERERTSRLKSAFVTVDHIASLNLDLVIFNTAVLSTGGHVDFAKDERNLAVPEYAVVEAVRALTPGSFCVFATHHPFGMLSEQNARYLEGEFAKHANLHIFGHMHDPQPRSVVGLKGCVLSDQAGALFTARREYYNGYSLITLDRATPHCEVLIRSYYKDRDEFDEGVDVIEGGRWYPSQEARQHFRKIANPVDETKFRAHLAGPALEKLRTVAAAVGGEGDLHERFVPPPMRRTCIQEVAGDEGRIEIETPVPFSDVVSGEANLILYAKAEYGRTTLLRELRYRFLSEAADTRVPRLPALIDFSEVGPTTEAMLRAVKAGAETPPDGNDIESLLKLGYFCLLVDDVNFGDGKRMKVVRDFVARYPKARYVLSSPQESAVQMGLFVKPEMALRFEFVEVREFKRNDMRLLLTKYEQCTDVEEWLDRLQNEFREINLPFTAANGSILMEILAEKHNFTPINRAVLMEQFVDSSLRKAAVEQSRREIFDYTNKTDLLAHTAAWMAREDRYIVPREALRAEMKSYVDQRGLNVGLDDLLDEFLLARIFITRNEDRISFRYRGVLEYFIALRMTVDTDFKTWVLDEGRYLRYVNEIQYYAGKHRSDADLVNLVRKRHEAIFADAMSDIGELDLHQLETIQLPTEGRGSDAVNHTATEVASPPLTKEERDTELEAEIPTDAEDRQEVFRPAIEESNDRVMFSLILYSGLVKNMELISDTDKRAHLAVLWASWGDVLVSSLRFAPRLAHERRIKINGAVYELKAPQGMSDATLLRQMMLQLPHVHVRMISNVLGTEKLERQLTEPTLDEKGQPAIFEFFRVGLMADLRLAGTPGAFEALATRLRGNMYLLWSLVIHFSELRRLDRIREEHFIALEEPLAGAIANLKGGSATIRADEKRKQLRRLAKDRLMLTMKRDK
jgi:Calcineurin-like phosphoesterase